MGCVEVFCAPDFTLDLSPSVVPVPAPPPPYTAPSIFFVFLALCGRYTRAVDAAGNNQSASLVRWFVDVDAPAAPVLVSGPDPVTLSRAASIVIHVRDDSPGTLTFNYTLTYVPLPVMCVCPLLNVDLRAAPCHVCVPSPKC
jgi:hypothetical protein